MKWHERLKTKLDELGWTGAELSRRSGVPEQSIWKYLQGERSMPRGETPRKLADAIGVSVAWLMHGDDLAAPNVVAIRQIPLTNLSGYDGRLTMLPKMIADAPEYIPIPADLPLRGEAMAYRVDEDAMTRLPAGSIVVVDRDRPPEPGRYVLAYSALLKRAVVRRWRAVDFSGAGQLVADSLDYPPIPMETAADGHVMGRVVLVISAL